MVAATTMAEKNDSKLDTQSLDSVAVHSVTSEPPPYKWSSGRSMKIARLIAFTVIVVAALLGGAIVLAAYIQTRGTATQCTAPETHAELSAPASSPLAAVEIRDSLLESDNSLNVSANKTQEEIQTETKEEKEVKAEEDDKEQEEEDKDKLGKLMKFPFNIAEIAKIFMELNRKDKTNCFVEKVNLDDPSARKPTRIMEVNGATVAIICESISSPKPVSPFPFNLPLAQTLMFRTNPLRLPFSSQPMIFPHQVPRPLGPFSQDQLLGLRQSPKPMPFPFLNIPARNLVAPARRLDSEEPVPSRFLVPPVRPQQNPHQRGIPLPDRILPPRPAVTQEVGREQQQPEQESASIPVSPLTVPSVRGNPDPVDRRDNANPGVPVNMPRPRGRSLNFDGPVIPFAEEKAPQPPRNNFASFLRSLFSPNRNATPLQPQQRSLGPAQAIPIPFPLGQRSENARELRLQPVITLPQFLRAPLADRSHSIQPRSVN